IDKREECLISFGMRGEALVYGGCMDSLKLDTSCTALILADLQRGIVGMPTSPYSGTFVVENGASLAAAFRRMYATVVYVRVDLSNMMSIAVDLSHGDNNVNTFLNSVTSTSSRTGGRL